MEKISLDHWFVGENTFNISLMRFFVSLQVRKNNKYIYIKMRVMDYDRHELEFNFYTLEDAIKFTEDVINKCYTTSEIVEQYQIMFKNNKFKRPETLILKK